MEHHTGARQNNPCHWERMDQIKLNMHACFFLKLTANLNIYQNSTTRDPDQLKLLPSMFIHYAFISDNNFFLYPSLIEYSLIHLLISNNIPCRIQPGKAGFRRRIPEAFTFTQ